jgi:uracil-DNA glycosylase
LSDWARQGILLLNTSLTYCKNLPELLKIWNTFTKNIISYIDNNLDGVIFVLWGNYANKYSQYIIRNKPFIISSGHPSFAHSHGKFFNTHPFSKINNLLIKNNKSPITW